MTLPRRAAHASRRTTVLAVVGLLAVTAVWGSTFPLLKDVIGRVPTADFLAVRFVLAAVAVLAISPLALRRLSRREWRHGLVLGLLYGVAQVAQTVGLEMTSASVSGFITGMYVVFTPLLVAVLLRRRVPALVWLAVAVATAGLAVLSLRGFALGGGESLTLFSALLYALHIVGLGAWSSARNALGLTVVQLMTVSVVCAVFAAPDGLTLPTRGGDWAALVYVAVAAGAGALLVQTWAQAHVAPARAAIIMTMEPVWAGVFAVVFGGEALGPRVLVGGALVLTAMWLVEGRRQPAARAAAAGAVTVGTGAAARDGAAGSRPPATGPTGPAPRHAPQ